MEKIEFNHEAETVSEALNVDKRKLMPSLVSKVGSNSSLSSLVEDICTDSNLKENEKVFMLLMAQSAVNSMLKIIKLIE